MADDSRDPFLERPGNLSGQESWFLFPRFAMKIKVSIILKMVKWNYQLAKQTWLVCELETVLLFNRFQFQNLSSGPKSYRPVFRETDTWSFLNNKWRHHDITTIVKDYLCLYTECKYGGSLGRPGSSCTKARLVRPREFCFDCAS